MPHSNGSGMSSVMNRFKMSSVFIKWRPNDNNPSLTGMVVLPRKSAESTLTSTVGRFVAYPRRDSRFSLSHFHLVFLVPKFDIQYSRLRDAQIITDTIWHISRFCKDFQ